MARTVDPKRKKVAESEKNLRLAQKELARIKVRILRFCHSMHCHPEYLQQDFVLLLCCYTMPMPVDLRQVHPPLSGIRY